VLAVREYAPFVEDPSVRRVQKGGAVQRRQPARELAEPPQSEIERRNSPPRSDTADEVPSNAEFEREIGPIGDSLRAPSEAGEELQGTERSPSSDREGQETEAPDPQ
jgi:hypothetical protein